MITVPDLEIFGEPTTPLGKLPYDGQAMGVSNYYPQRPLTNHRRHIDAIGQYTQALIDVIDPPLLWNYSPFHNYFNSHFHTEGVHFTDDYIVDADDNISLLKGGPHHHLGTHPCWDPLGDFVRPKFGNISQ